MTTKVGCAVLINMWMIANMLREKMLTLNIADDAPMNLYGVGSSEAPGRAGLMPSGKDLVLVSGNSTITIEDCSLLNGFDTVSEVFHLYNEWYNDVCAYCRNGQWQELIDCTQPFFTNPIVLFDPNMQVLAMSSSFPSGTVDEEWEFLLKYRVSSPKTVRTARSKTRFMEKMNSSGIVFSESSDPEKQSYLSISIINNDHQWGYLSATDTVCRIGRGAVDTLTALSRIISSTLTEQSVAIEKISQPTIFQACIESPDVQNLKQMSNYLEYYSYNEAGNYIVTVTAFQPDDYIEAVTMMYNALINSVEIPVVIKGNELITVLDTASPLYSKGIENVRYLTTKYDVVTVESLEIQNIRNTYYAYEQCRFVLSRVDPEPNSYLRFYDHVIDYLVLTSDRNALLNACNQQIIRFMRMGKKEKEAIGSLEVYIRNGRSILATAKELSIHKNTVTYRIRNTLERTGIDLDNRYDREYALLSFTVLHALGW